MNVKWARNIKLRMTMLGWRHIDIEHATGMSQQSWYKTRQQSNPTLKTIKRVALLLCVDIAHLVDESETPTISSVPPPPGGSVAWLEWCGNNRNLLGFGDGAEQNDMQTLATLKGRFDQDHRRALV